MKYPGKLPEAIGSEGRVVMQCRTCKGAGVVYEQTGKASCRRHRCPRCDGTGIRVKIA